MIKKYNQFIREFIETTGFVDTKMQELKDLIDGVSDGENIIYEWENKEDHQLLVNFTTGELSLRYEFDIDDLNVTKIAGDTVDFKTDVESIEEGLDLIEKDIQSILGIDEKGKIPKKYLTRKPKAMKKEIEKFKGKKEYKKDWDADYDKRSGKRIKTKKSSSTKAYQKMFGKK